MSNSEKPKSKVCRDGKRRGTGRPRFPESNCLTPKCTGKFGGAQEKPGGRGLCHACHGKASALVKRKFTTWDEMEKLGLAQPKYGSLVELGIKNARKNQTVESVPVTEKDS